VTPLHPAALLRLPAVLRLGTASCLVVTGWIHTDLYLGGYRGIPTVGPGFLLQASASFAVAALLLVGAPDLVQVAAAALAAGSLTAFALSRTVGLAGFTERGWQPAPQALLSVLAEAAVLLLAAAAAMVAYRDGRLLAWRRRDPAPTPG
jgi:hypothetical protein